MQPLENQISPTAVGRLCSLPELHKFLFPARHVSLTNGSLIVINVFSAPAEPSSGGKVSMVTLPSAIASGDTENSISVPYLNLRRRRRVVSSAVSLRIARSGKYLQQTGEKGPLNLSRGHRGKVHYTNRIFLDWL